jgi:hypothetical protein
VQRHTEKRFVCPFEGKAQSSEGLLVGAIERCAAHARCRQASVEGLGSVTDRSAESPSSPLKWTRRGLRHAFHLPRIQEPKRKYRLSTRLRPVENWEPSTKSQGRFATSVNLFGLHRIPTNGAEMLTACATPGLTVGMQSARRRSSRQHPASEHSLHELYAHGLKQAGPSPASVSSGRAAAMPNCRRLGMIESEVSRRRRLVRVIADSALVQALGACDSRAI